MLEKTHSHIRIVANVDEDAFATQRGKDDYEIHIVVRIAYREAIEKRPYAFAFAGGAEAVTDLVGRLKKDKSIDLIARSETSGLVADHVRIDRIEFKLTPEEPLLPSSNGGDATLPSSASPTKARRSSRAKKK